LRLSGPMARRVVLLAHRLRLVRGGEAGPSERVVRIMLPCRLSG